MSYLHPDVLRNLSDMKASANQMCLCSQEPTTRIEATTTYSLLNIAMATGDFTWIGSGVGEQLQVAEKANQTLTATGTITYIALVDGTRLLSTTPFLPNIPVELGRQITINSWSIVGAAPV